MSNFLNLNALIDWLEHLPPRTLDQTTCDEINAFQQFLKDNHYLPTVPVITVTGTNGKGSVVKILGELLTSATYSVGSFCSPHLVRYNERICFNQQAINDDQFLAIANEIYQQHPSYPWHFFNFLLAVALQFFKQQAVDFVILEVGIGGRYDFCNAIDADVVGISSIDIDHQALLGSTREDIAYQKAGLFRSFKKVVCGEPDPPQAIYDEAEKYSSEISFIGRDFGFYETGFFHKKDAPWHFWNKNVFLPSLPKPPLYLANAATALMIVDALSLAIPIKAIKKGLLNSKLKGRYTLLNDKPKIIADVAHNPAAVKLLAKKIVAEKIPGKHWAVFGLMADKDLAGTVSPLLPLIDEWYVCALPTPRALSSEALQEYLLSQGAKVVCANSPKEAYQLIKAKMMNEDLLIAYGSFRVVGDIME